MNPCFTHRLKLLIERWSTLFASVAFIFASVAAMDGICEASVVYLESGGLVVGEAEVFSRRTSAGSAGWVVKPTENGMVDDANGGPTVLNARGGAYIQGLPNTNVQFPPLSGPSIEYDLRISTVGNVPTFSTLGRGGNQPS